MVGCKTSQPRSRQGWPESPAGVTLSHGMPRVRAFAPFFRALNSAVECHLHTVEVAGSNPAAPTIKSTTYGQSCGDLRRARIGLRRVESRMAELRAAANFSSCRFPLTANSLSAAITTVPPLPAAAPGGQLAEAYRILAHCAACSRHPSEPRIRGRFKRRRYRNPHQARGGHLRRKHLLSTHYFGTYPYAANPEGEPRFVAKSGSPGVNGLTDALLYQNPNLLNTGNGTVLQSLPP